MARLVIMKKGGESGEIAINPDLVTHVRATPGQFTDVYFGEHRVAVEGGFRQVVEKLCAPDAGGAELGQHPGRTWINAGRN
jgi:hypothetical protein